MTQWEKENHLHQKGDGQSFLDWIVGTCDRLLFGPEATVAQSEPEAGLWASGSSETHENPE